MSAIGDYIHYTAYGYNVYGARKIGQKPDIVGDHDKIRMFNNYKQNLKRKIQREGSFLTAQEKNEIENLITNVLQNPTEDKMNEDFFNALAKDLKLDFKETMSLFTRQAAQNNIKLQTVLKKANQQTKYTTKSKIINSIQQINTAIDELTRIGEGTSADKLKNIKNQIKRLVVVLSNEARESTYRSGYKEVAQNYNRVIGRLEEHITSPISGARGQIINKINDAVDIINKCLNLKKGTAFEYVCAYAIAKAKNKGIEEIIDTVNKAVVGQDVSAVKLDKRKFIEESGFIDLINKNHTYFKKVNDDVNIYTANETQDKIDVNIDFKGKELRISAKNVNLWNSNISLVNQTNMLLLIQTMQPAFVNHWLNTIVLHRYSSKPNSRIQDINNNVIIAGELAMKASLFLSAIQGHKLDRQKANVFVVNNNTASQGHKKVSVFTIDDIFDNIFNNLENSIIKDSIEIDSAISSALANTWVEAGSLSRIDNILAALHGWQVSIKLRSADIRNLMA